LAQGKGSSIAGFNLLCIGHTAVIAMADALAELEREVAKQKEEQEAEDKRRRHSQNMLSSLDRMPQETKAAPAKEQPDKAREKAEATSAQSQSAAPPPAPAPAANTGSATSYGSSAYIPPSWSTAPRPEGNFAPAAGGSAGLGGEVNLSPAAVLEGPAQTLPGMCGCGANGQPFGQELFAMAGLHPPNEESFDSFFKRWFELDHFPIMAEALKQELVRRAKSKSFLSGLSSQFKKFAMANTDARLQADVWCKYFLENSPPKHRIVGCVRLVSANLGAQAAPCWLTFWGFQDSKGDSWHLPPWSSSDADIGAVLDELDGRGGMTALLAASA